MNNRTMVPPYFARAMAVKDLRNQILEGKAQYRSYLARAPIPEKLRILEEMRDFTFATQRARDENKALMAHAWTRAC